MNHCGIGCLEPGIEEHHERYQYPLSDIESRTSSIYREMVLLPLSISFPNTPK